jgi:hypothetical protein
MELLVNPQSKVTEEFGHSMAGSTPGLVEPALIMRTRHVCRRLELSVPAVEIGSRIRI